MSISIFNKWSALDAQYADAQIEAAHGGPVFSRGPLSGAYDTPGGEESVQFAFGNSFTKWAALDPGRARYEIDQANSGSYFAKAVHFDGATYITNPSLTAPSSVQWSMVLWFKTTQSAGEATLFVVDPDNTVVPYIDLPAGAMDVEILSAGPAIFEGITSQTFKDGVWRCMIFSIDGTGGAPRKNKLYMGDTAVAFGGLFKDQGTESPVTGNGLKAQAGYDDTDANGFFIGDIADYRIFYGVSLLDGSGDIPQATRRLFIDGNGKPVDPAIAAAALGTPGTILFSGDASSFATNQGTGGTFTTTGALTNASTSPSA